MKIKNKKQNGKLLLQTAMVILPIFFLIIGAVVWAVYNSSVNGYLKAQEKFISRNLESTLYALDLYNMHETLSDVSRWYIDHMFDVPVNEPLEMSDEEIEKNWELVHKESWGTESWFTEMSDDDARIIIKKDLMGLIYSITTSTSTIGLNCLVVLDAENPARYRAVNYAKDISESYFGNFCDFDISRHPALRDAIASQSRSNIFERSKDIPAPGNYYIGYTPAFDNGKLVAYIGLAYNWDDMKQSISMTVFRMTLIIVIGMVLLMIFIMQFLYFRAIKPVSDIKRALLGYSSDKSSKMIVKKMYDIRKSNEIGYLADVISDFALEIDRTTKEKIRIAVECEQAKTAQERAEKEAYEAKVAVMTSQIRPHFMYNALTSIAMMCRINPETAQEAIITFAKYLRGNMDSLKQTAPVPFETELEHLKQYLYIEKLRFGKKLNIVYDIQAADFKIPMLSVQPLVENAVKHGVGMKKGGGTVKITSLETDSAFKIIISDNGVGFDTSAARKDDGRSHIGMENTRRRLKEMCSGEIQIESTVGEGTTVTITLPKEKQKNEDSVP